MYMPIKVSPFHHHLRQNGSFSHLTFWNKYSLEINKPTQKCRKIKIFNCHKKYVCIPRDTDKIFYYTTVWLKTTHCWNHCPWPKQVISNILFISQVLHLPKKNSCVNKTFVRDCKTQVLWANAKFLRQMQTHWNPCRGFVKRYECSSAQFG